jgi:hypothetical protein
VPACASRHPPSALNHRPPPPPSTARRRPRRPRPLHASRRWQGEGLETDALKPHKAKIKEAVDGMMKKILAERAAAEAEAAAEAVAAAEAAAAAEAVAAAAEAPAEGVRDGAKSLDGATSLAEGERLEPAVEALLRSEP